MLSHPISRSSRAIEMLPSDLKTTPPAGNSDTAPFASAAFAGARIIRDAAMKREWHVMVDPPARTPAPTAHRDGKHGENPNAGDILAGVKEKRPTAFLSPRERHGARSKQIRQG